MTASTPIEPIGSSTTEFTAIRAVTPFICVPEGAKIRVTRLDGLVLTVEPLDTEHAPTGDASPAEEMSEETR